jgi:two-component system response regulator FixJ
MISNRFEVYIVKDDGPTEQTLTSLFSAAGILSRTFDGGNDFLMACDRLPPGCVVTNLRTGGMDAPEFLRRLNAGPLSFPAIFIANRGEVRQTVEAMKAGAATVLERPYGDEALIGAVRSALQVNARTAAQAAQRSLLAALTPREREVLTGLVDGKTNQMTARHLGISQRTVQVYRASMMKKSGVVSVAELVRLSFGARRSRGVAPAVASTAEGETR